MKYLERSFILYKPKDIVAGKFYWMEYTQSSQSNNLILVASCDCKGHRAPDAMISVICNNALNRSVREFKLTDPGEILNKTREIVIQEFEKSDEDVHDGMDISLAVLNIDDSKKKYKLKWARANNPLWIIRKDSQEVEEVKPNKTTHWKI